MKKIFAKFLIEGSNFIHITIFEILFYISADGIWKGQNRRTGQVGFIQSNNVDIIAGTISGKSIVSTPKDCFY